MTFYSVLSIVEGRKLKNAAVCPALCCGCVLHYTAGMSRITLRVCPALCLRSLRPYVVGHPDLMWSVTPTLCSRTPRPYVVGHSGLMWSVTPTLCGRSLRPYRGKNCTSLHNSCFGFYSHKTRLSTAFRHPWRNVQTQHPSAFVSNPAHGCAVKF